MTEYTKKTRCVLCLSENLTKLTNFPETPIANQLFEPELLPPHGQTFYPLNLCMCLNCRHIQIDTLIDPRLLFSNYPYLSNSSAEMALRLERIAKRYIVDFSLEVNDFVLEIGSNDGFLLSFFKQNGCKVLGVDPASEPTSIALQAGIETIMEFFTAELACEIQRSQGIPNLIIANNVLAHSDNLRDIFKGLSLLMGDDTVMILEFSYVVDVFQLLLFDTIYHEHTSYHSIKPLSNFLNDFELEIFKVERFDAHGGSARIFIQKKSAAHRIDKSVFDIIQYEDTIGVHETENWSHFNHRIETLSKRINSHINEIINREEKIFGYGAPAKFSSLFHILRLNEKAFQGVLDDNPFKVGKCAPGTSLLILDTLSPRPIDHIFIFSWNYADAIIAKVKNSKLANKSVIVPLPEYKVYSL